MVLFSLCVFVVDMYMCVYMSALSRVCICDDCDDIFFYAFHFAFGRKGLLLNQLAAHNLC